MKHVLLVTYAFPPRLGIRSVMVSKMAKYLPDFGWQPTVLTAPPPPGATGTIPVEIPEADIFRVQDRFRFGRIGNNDWNSPVGAGQSSVLPEQKIPEQKMLAKQSRRLQFLRQLSGWFPWSRRIAKLWRFERPNWYPNATRMAETLMATRQFDAILSASNPPYTVNLTASRIQSRSGLPWVAEFPDLWSHNHVFETSISPFEVAIEKRVMRNAAHLVTVSEPMAEILHMIHAKPVTVIHNGFDEVDYSLPETVTPKSKFTITYTGEIYRQRDPSALFGALRVLKDRGEITSENFEVIFYGSTHVMSTIFGLASQYEIQDLVKLGGWIPLQQSRQEQQASTLLLLLEWTDTTRPGVYTGKVFEYLGARRPILVVGPKGGVVDTLMQKTRAGIVLETNEEIVSALSLWIKEWRAEGQIKYEPDEEQVKRYTRREQAGRMAALLDAVTTANKS